jgi:hypothetical protein
MLLGLKIIYKVFSYDPACIYYTHIIHIHCIIVLSCNHLAIQRLVLFAQSPDRSVRPSCSRTNPGTVKGTRHLTLSDAIIIMLTIESPMYTFISSF